MNQILITTKDERAYSFILRDPYNRSGALACACNLIELLHQARLAACGVILMNNSLHSGLVERAASSSNGFDPCFARGLAVDNQLLGFANERLDT